MLSLTWSFAGVTSAAWSAGGGEADLPDAREAAELDRAARPLRHHEKRSRSSSYGINSPCCSDAPRGPGSVGTTAPWSPLSTSSRPTPAGG